MGPHAPDARRAPAKPWRASICRQSTSPSRITRRGRVAFDEVPLGVVSLRHFSVTFPGGLALAHPMEASVTSAPVERVIKEDSRMDVKSMDRRYFLKTTGIAGILAARQAPAFAQGSTLHWVRWVDFIPESDVELKRQMPEAEKALGAKIQFETINANDLQPRITAAVQSGSGADIFNFQYNWPHLHQNAGIDVSDVAGALSKAEGGFYEVWAPSCQVNGKWLSVPHSIVGNAVAHRKSWLKEVGASAYPKTWDEARKVFAALKKKGHPYGQTLGHTFGDAPTFTYPMTWAFGAAETDKSGKKVVLNSKGALEAVKFMQAFWKECCDDGGLAWDDTNNNRALHASKLDEPLKMFRTAARNPRLFGHAGPSTAKATEAFTKYIITDMYAKGVQGMSAEDAVKWAEGELKKIYEA